MVVFLDADAIPAEGWAAGLHRALDEFPAAVVACARTFTARTRWGWVAHLEFETPFLPQGEPGERPALSSFCVALPRDAPLRWHESYGGEDGLFSVDALGPASAWFSTRASTPCMTTGGRRFADLRRQQRRFVYGFARARRLIGGPSTGASLRASRFTTSRCCACPSSTAAFDPTGACGLGSCDCCPGSSSESGCSG